MLSRHDFYPFGAEINAQSSDALLIDGFESGDLTAWGDGPDELAVKYTGHERDLHRLSDYMRGRTCLYPLRRFASPDPGRDGWNLYSYTLNNPIKYLDPDGLAVVFAGAREPDYERNAAIREAFKRDLEGRLPFIGGKVGDAVDALVLSSLFPASPAEFAANADPASFLMPLSSGPGIRGLLGPGARGTEKGSQTAIGKVKDLQGLGPGENTLLKHLPDQGSPRANWAQNSGVLRREMSKGRPIRDASVDPTTGNLIEYPGSFLNAERNLLREHGWTFEPGTGLWSPP